MMSDEIIPHSFRSTVQQLVSDCDRHASSAASSGIVSGLLNRVESTLSIVEEGFNLLSASPLFSAECTLLSTFRSSCTVDLNECGIISSLIMRLESLLEPSHETIQPYSNCALFGKRCTSFVQRSSRFSQKSDRFVENIESIICTV